MEEHDERQLDREGHFLDVAFKVDGSNALHYSMYRKTLNSYDYVPFQSCHAKATFRAVVMTELHRLLLTNIDEHSFNEQVDFSFCRFL